MSTPTKERPILFSAEMVRAILDGRKTVTRRPVRFPRNRDALVLVEQRDGSLWPYQSDDGESEICDDGCEHPIACPYGSPGDRLWVRETWYCDHCLVDCDDLGGAKSEEAKQGEMRELMYYRASDIAPCGECYTGFSGETMRVRWRSSIHMPRWASRITLEVTGVRVEQVQEMRGADYHAEGFGGRPRSEFGEGWDALYKGKPEFQWAANPWVWVVEFKRLEAPDA